MGRTLEKRKTAREQDVTNKLKANYKAEFEPMKEKPGQLA